MTAVKVNMSMQADLLALVDEYCQTMGYQTRSEVVRLALIRLMGTYQPRIVRTLEEAYKE